MARRIDDFELDPAIVLIADEVDSSPAAVSGWFESLKRLEPCPDISRDTARDIAAFTKE